jgi:hypothetical protein
VASANSRGGHIVDLGDHNIGLVTVMAISQLTTLMQVLLSAGGVLMQILFPDGVAERLRFIGMASRD